MLLLGTVDMVRGGVRKFVYDMDRPAILKGHLEGMVMEGKWEILV